MPKSSRKRVSVTSSRKHWRISALVLFVFGLSAVLIARLAMLQVVQHDSYVSRASAQQSVSHELPPERGEIFLSDQGDPYPVAVNRQYFLAYAVPGEVRDPMKAAHDLSVELNLDESILLEKFVKTHDPFEVLKHRLSDEEVDRVRSMRIEGIFLLPEIFRYYPGFDLASQTIGFVGMRDDHYEGRYGIEASFEESLKGEAGFVSSKRDASGRRISIGEKSFLEPESGANIVLTIERVVQYEIEKILKESMEAFQADGGTIVVMDPKTGSILGLASFPDFNPNEYAKTENVETFLNPAVSLAYEPGSVMKPITMAIGIEDGKVNAHTEYVDTGFVKEGGFVIKNAEGKVYGRSTMIQVLDESINTGVIFVERLVGNERFREYFTRFGFGAKTGIPLPAETAGNIRNLDNTNRSTEFFTASFGQGVTVTPIQLVSAYAALANGGILMKPRIVDRQIFSDGRVEEVPPEEVRSVVSKETAREIGMMLRDVVVNGHGKRADVPGYLVVGKTGTAQVAKSDAKGYEEGTNIGSFAGYAPLNDPRFTVLVKIDNPKNVEWAESSAAPTFQKVMKFLLESSNIEPTETVEK
ncbi:MAG: penicillin-binding protein 2 [Candidatus Moraniibacteriota bacterium]|nr:MAG: penicillin-binding protein 2 [Candidatus Moranbacteria bacterium]